MATTGVCGGCFGGAGNVILQGMAGDGRGLIVGISRLQIRIVDKDAPRRPGGVAGPIPQPVIQNPIPREDSDPNLVEVYISIKWPFMDKWKRLQFIMEKKWANVVVNRINQINTFNEKFTVKFGELKDNFKVKFGGKWKK